MTDLRGPTLGKYQLRERLGRGGMAEVYRAWHPDLERHVAIKVLHNFLAETPGFLDRFKREAKAVAQLRHPHIVQVFDFDRHNDISYMVMEYVPGPTLKTVLDLAHEHGQHLPWPIALAIFRALLEAVGYAHAHGMVHRDLKPGNVLLDINDWDATPPAERYPRLCAGWPFRTVLTDFGIAKIIGAERLTQSGLTVGTPHYLSPEQAAGEPGDLRSDLYALGIMLFESLSGQVPFDAPTAPAVLLKHLSAPIPSLQTLLPDLPAPLEGFIQRALAKQAAQRFQTAAEMRAALETLAASDKRPPPPALSEPTLPLPNIAPKRGLGRWPRAWTMGLIGGLLIALLTLGFVGLNAWGGASATQAALATAQAQTETGDYQLAVDSYTLVLNRDPANLAALLGRAWAYEQLGQVDDALDDYAAVLAAAPNNALAHAETTRIALQYGSGFNPEAWLADLNFAVDHATDTEKARALYLRGWAVFTFALVDGAPNPTRALPDLQQAAQLAPQRAEHHFTLAQTYLALGQATEALQAANRVIELAPDAAVHYKLRAHAQFVLGDYFAAIDDLTLALERETSPALAATLYAERAYLNAQVNLSQAAQADLAAALTHDPTSTIAGYVQAWLDPAQPRPTALRPVPDDPIWQAIVRALTK
jgi:serine/threonine-protein kinase